MTQGSLGSGVDRFVGCLMAGAAGDALGAPVEFDSLAGIRSRLGEVGVTGFLPAYGRVGAVTDDTQMTLFTAEGLLRAEQRYRDRGLVNVDAVVLRAYQRWLCTQVGPDRVPWDPEMGDGSTSGWLIAQEFLHSRRAPGNTCLSALGAGGWGGVDRPLNDSKGCGGVMRAAPAGLVGADPFDLGCRIAALTHGHPSGFVAAGALAVMVSEVVRGRSLAAAVAAGRDAAAGHPGGSEVVEAIDAAVDLAGGGVPAGPEAVESLGAGWVAEEALAIAVYCALAAEAAGGDIVRRGVLMAVNHSGDSDSTGSIAGNLLGAVLGVGAVPAEWLDELEGAAVIRQVACDLHEAFVAGGPIDISRYPTW